MPGVAPRLALLLLVVQVRRDRVMGVVHFLQEIGDGELQLVGPQPSGLVLQREAQPRAEEQEDVGGLRDQLPARLEDGRRERRASDPRVVENVHQCRHAHA